MADPEPPSKPAILQESHFIVEEGILHRVFRTGAIWLNKLFFSSAVLWGIWLLVGYSQGLQECGGGIGNVGNNSTEDLSVVAEGTCSVMLTPTSKYLGAMTFLSFLGSISMGLLGLVVGKRVIETTAVADEPGSEERAGARGNAAGAGHDAGEATGPNGDVQESVNADGRAEGPDGRRHHADEAHRLGDPHDDAAASDAGTAGDPPRP